jgi:hypothetical protein
MNPKTFIRTNLNCRLLLVVFLIPAITINAFCQNNGIETSIWYLPGITWQDSARLRLMGQFGINTPQSVNAFYLQAFVKAGRYITLNPAWLYLSYPNAGGTSIREHTIMNAMIITIPFRHLLIEDRNLIWDRFRKDLPDIHFYRNRLRVFRPFTWSAHTIKLYAFDEAWLFLNDLQFTRNRLAIGLACDIIPSFNVDIFFAREHDHTNGRTNLIFLMGTLQLSRKRIPLTTK